MFSSSFAAFFAQVTNAATGAAAPDGTTPTPSPQPWWTSFFFPFFIVAMLYFAFFRPQQQAKKKAEETIKGAKTGDRIVTSSGIHGTITNVKDSTVIVRVADAVKIEIEKSHIDKITRSDADAEKTVAAKVS
jgi:preprotein translocase subunit YajC